MANELQTDSIRLTAMAVGANNIKSSAYAIAPTNHPLTYYIKQLAVADWIRSAFCNINNIGKVSVAIQRFALLLVYIFIPVRYN